VNSQKGASGPDFFHVIFFFFFVFRIFSLSRARTRIYSLEEFSNPSIGGTSIEQHTSGEPILAQLRNGNFFTSLDHDDSNPHVSNMFYILKPLVPLGTLYV